MSNDRRMGFQGDVSDFEAIAESLLRGFSDQALPVAMRVRYGDLFVIIARPLEDYTEDFLHLFELSLCDLSDGME